MLVTGADTSHVTATTASDGAAVRALLAEAARLLATNGVVAIPDVVERGRQTLGLDRLTLLLCGITPAPRRAGDPRFSLDVPVRGRGGQRGLLTATAGAAFTGEQAAVLLALADMLSLALSDRPAQDEIDAAQAVLDAEADLAMAAGELDEVADAIVALRHVAPSAIGEGVAAALAHLRAVQRSLRAVSLEAGLRAALIRLDADVVATDPGLDQLAPAVAALLQRIAEAVARGGDGRARIYAEMDSTTVKLRAELADNGYDAFELSRWSRRVSALGGELRRSPEGVEVWLPTTTRDDGDNGSHL